MSKRVFFEISLILFLALALSITLSVRLIRASGTIYIRPDGSVDPPTAPIQRVGDLYTFTADINEPIVIQKDYVTVDGNGFKLQGSGAGNGFEMQLMHGISVLNTDISGFSKGIYVLVSGPIEVRGNTLTNSGVGVEVVDSSNCNIHDNSFSGNTNAGIRFYSAVTYSTIDGNSIQNSNIGILMEAVLEISNNNIVNNLIAHNNIGVRIDSTAAPVSTNTFYHNNLIENTQQVGITGPFPGSYPTNSWNNGYPTGGNYWSDYSDVDLFKGPNQDEIGSDGIWDHPYVIATNNVDRYPFTQQSGWESPPPPPPPPLPEFPLGFIMPLATLPLLLYLWLRRKQKTPQ